MTYVIFEYLLCAYWTSLVAQTVERLSTMRETRVRPLGWEDPLEKEMAIHSSTIAWKIPWTEEAGRLQSMGLQRVGHDWATSLHLSSSLQHTFFLELLTQIWRCLHHAYSDLFCTSSTARSLALLLWLQLHMGPLRGEALRLVSFIADSALDHQVPTSFFL